MTQPPANPPLPPPPEQVGLFGQFQRTREALMGLLQAHIELLRAEINEILDQLKLIATQAGVALAFALIVGTMLYVGGFLFIGEWLFGSMGWGFAMGVLFGIDMIVLMVLGIIGARASSAAISFVLALLVTVGLALVLGYNIASDAAANTAGQLADPVNSPGLVAAIGGAIVFGILFLLIFWRMAGTDGAFAGLIVGLIVGLLLGWLIAGAPWTWPPAVGFAITIGLIFWPLFAFAIAWPSIDIEERFSRLYPRQSIEAAQETREWLEEQWQSRRP